MYSRVLKGFAVSFHNCGCPPEDPRRRTGAKADCGKSGLFPGLLSEQTVCLLPQEEWDDIENQYGIAHKDLLEERKRYKELSSDQLVECIEKELKKLSFIKEEDG